MRIEDSKFNPLPTFLENIPEDGGLPLNNKSMALLAKLWNLGGVYAQSNEELFALLNLFSDLYGLTEVIEDKNVFYLRKINGNEVPQ